jgi:hypothetical protein
LLDETSRLGAAASTPETGTSTPAPVSPRGKFAVVAWPTVTLLLVVGLLATWSWRHRAPGTVLAPMLIVEENAAETVQAAPAERESLGNVGAAGEGVPVGSVAETSADNEGAGFGGVVADGDASEPGPPETVTIDDWKAAARGDGPTALAALTFLLDDTSEPARSAVKSLVAGGGAPASRAIAAIASRRALAHVGALESGLMSDARPLALESVAALSSLRSTEAFELLRRAAETHGETGVRDAARRESEAMFSVEE